MDESLQKSGSRDGWFWGKELSPGAEIFRIEHSQQCAKNVAKRGTLIFEAHFPVTGITAFRSNEVGELKRA